MSKKSNASGMFFIGALGLTMIIMNMSWSLLALMLAVIFFMVGILGAYYMGNDVAGAANGSDVAAGKRVDMMPFESTNRSQEAPMMMGAADDVMEMHHAHMADMQQLVNDYNRFESISTGNNYFSS